MSLEKQYSRRHRLAMSWRGDPCTADGSDGTPDVIATALSGHDCACERVNRITVPMQSHGYATQHLISGGHGTRRPPGDWGRSVAKPPAERCRATAYSSVPSAASRDRAGDNLPAHSHSPDGGTARSPSRQADPSRKADKEN